MKREYKRREGFTLVQYIDYYISKRLHNSYCIADIRQEIILKICEAKDQTINLKTKQPLNSEQKKIRKQMYDYVLANKVPIEKNIHMYLKSMIEGQKNLHILKENKHVPYELRNMTLDENIDNLDYA